MVTLDTDALGVATLLLNRPDEGNRYDPPMLDTLAAHLATIASDGAVRCVVLRGAGRHFCVGADVGWHAGATAAPTGATGFLEVLLMLDALPKPVIAVVQGACIGGGLAFAACCDVVLASRAAFFSIPEVRLGFAPSALIPFFQRAIGPRALRRYALSGERFPAEAAMRFGLVSQLFDPGDEDAALAPVVQALLLGGPRAQARTKTLAAEFDAASADLARMRALEADFASSIRSDEAIEGLRAFRERRPPRWQDGVRDLDA